MRNRIDIHSKGDVESRWNMNNPAHCRDFLKALRIGPNGSAIETLTQADGKQVTIDEARDEAILDLVNEFAKAMERK